MTNLVTVNQIVTPTQRWQVTVPKKIREELGLVERVPLNVTSDNGKITMIPIKRVVKEDIWTEARRKKLLSALKEIRGIWTKDWPGIKKRLEKQRKFEIEVANQLHTSKVCIETNL